MLHFALLLYFEYFLLSQMHDLMPTFTFVRYYIRNWYLIILKHIAHFYLGFTTRFAVDVIEARQSHLVCLLFSQFPNG